MDRAAHPHPSSIDALRGRNAVFIAFEESLVGELSKAARAIRAAGAPAEAEKLELVVRTHRISLIKHRAVMGASGLDE